MVWQSPADGPAPAPQRGRRRGGVLVWTGAVLLAASVVVGVTGLVKIVMSAGAPLVEAASAPVLTTPVERSMVLQPSAYVIFEQTGSSLDGTTMNSVTPGDAVVTDPGGRPVRVRSHFFETLDRGGDRYSAAVEFTASTAGTYRISVRPDPPTRVIITRSPEAGLSGLGPWAISLFAAAVGVVVGLVLLAIGLFRRFRRPREPVGPPAAVPVPGPPPPGWYPDRTAAGRSRFWDGLRWTDHVR